MTHISALRVRLRRPAALGLTALAAFAVTSCASMNQKVLKAPCGPTAGMTDPCGNATPINSRENIDRILRETGSV